ncbi:hypothetical protein [Arthrobacter cryoconiti]|uniref:Uncharacterized protein n=1 Tax=Arthrobacter cryoconiti TaxID=748907 RepID=A0ABV8QY67_9MICC|nr:hypothetical protein [Arthrobacter cryoconiti]MCC9069019.1 hypothetical protein [Arthrobacter cryoconiti]
MVSPIFSDVVEPLRAKYVTIPPRLDKQAARLLPDTEARSLGHSGVSTVARASVAARSKSQHGVNELEAGTAPLQGDFKPGAGRKALPEKGQAWS